MITNKKADRLTKFGRIIHPKNGIILLLSNLLKKLRKTGSIDRRNGSGRPRTVSTEADMGFIENLVYLQEEWPHANLASRKIAGKTGIVGQQYKE